MQKKHLYENTNQLFDNMEIINSNKKFRFATDECFNNKMLSGIRNAFPELDIMRVQDAWLSVKDDPAILEWLAKENRILLTHDIAALKDFAYERVRMNLFMPGVLVVKPNLPVKAVIDDVILIVECSKMEEWIG